MRKFPAVFLPLPLGEVALRSKDGEGARRQPYFKVSKATRNFAATTKSRPLGEGGCERSEQTEGVSLYNRYNPRLSRPY